jgi:hypothetical protein
MTRAADWMASRSPDPPPDLAEALAFDHTGEALDDVLASEAGARLAAARARLGRVRESAFRLLEADALLTYACEAALERDDPEPALRRILHSTR